jgi:hypothetical protein
MRAIGVIMVKRHRSRVNAISEGRRGLPADDATARSPGGVDGDGARPGRETSILEHEHGEEARDRVHSDVTSGGEVAGTRAAVKVVGENVQRAGDRPVRVAVAGRRCASPV